MIEKWKVIREQIKRALVVRETEHFVFLPPVGNRRQGKREVKQSDDWMYFDTWQDAKNHIVSNKRKALSCSKARVKMMQRQLKDAIAIRKPEQKNARAKG